MNEHLPIKFQFNAKKAAQAAYKILQLSGGRRNYMELVKLLYLADREALIRLQSQITGDRLVALRFGMVLSRILDLIRWGPITEEDAPWFDAVSPPEGYDVKCIRDPGDDELSGAECLVLEETFAKYGRMDWRELSRTSHALPEWSDPTGGAIPVTPDQILRLEGRTVEEIQLIRDELAAFERMDREIAAFRGQEYGVSVNTAP